MFALTPWIFLLSFIMMCVMIYVIVTSPFVYQWNPHSSFSSHLRNLEPENIPYCLATNVQIQQGQMFRTLVTALDRANILYWVTGKTLLNLVKFGILAPWEDSISIAINFSDRENVLKLDVRPYIIVASRGGGPLRCENHFDCFPVIDIDLTILFHEDLLLATPAWKNQDGKYETTCQDSQRRRTSVYAHADVFPPKQKQINVISDVSEELTTFAVRLPYNAQRCLEKEFGLQCNQAMPTKSLSVFVNNRCTKSMWHRLTGLGQPQIWIPFLGPASRD